MDKITKWNWPIIIYLLLLLGLVCGLLFGRVAQADSLACGLPPLAPLGCIDARPVCSCTADGVCQWIFIGCL